MGDELKPIPFDDFNKIADNLVFSAELLGRLKTNYCIIKLFLEKICIKNI